MPSALLLLLLLVCSGCTGTAILGDDGLSGDDDSVAPGDDDDVTPGDDDDDNDDGQGDDDDNDDRPDFEGIFGNFMLLGGVHHPQGQGTWGWGYFLRELDSPVGNDADAASRPPNGPAPGGPGGARGPRGVDFGCTTDLPDSDRFGRGEGGEEFETLDGGPFARFRRGQRVWELEHHQDGGEHWYSVGPDETPSDFPPVESLRFDTPGGSDLPGMEIRNAMPVVSIFPVARPGLAIDADILRIASGEPLQFAWTPREQEGVELVLLFEDPEQERHWEIKCWVADNGSFEINASMLSQMPVAIFGQTWIRRYETDYEELSEDNPEMWFTGAFQHHWTIVLEPNDAPPPGPGPMPG
jgi:hypothetical protein